MPLPSPHKPLSAQSNTRRGASQQELDAYNQRITIMVTSLLSLMALEQARSGRRFVQQIPCQTSGLRPSPPPPHSLWF